MEQEAPPEIQVTNSISIMEMLLHPVTQVNKKVQAVVIMEATLQNILKCMVGDLRSDRPNRVCITKPLHTNQLTRSVTEEMQAAKSDRMASVSSTRPRSQTLSRSTFTRSKQQQLNYPMQLEDLGVHTKARVVQVAIAIVPVLLEQQHKSALALQRLEKIQDHLCMAKGAIQLLIAQCTILVVVIIEQIENRTLVTQADLAMAMLTPICQDQLRTKQHQEPTVLNISVARTRAGPLQAPALDLIMLSSMPNPAI